MPFRNSRGTDGRVELSKRVLAGSFLAGFVRKTLQETNESTHARLFKTSPPSSRSSAIVDSIERNLELSENCGYDFLGSCIKRISLFTVMAITNMREERSQLPICQGIYDLMLAKTLNKASNLACIWITLLSYCIYVNGYCPKGFIFGHEKTKLAVLVDLLSDLNHNFLSDVLQFVRHDHCYYSECNYQAHDLSAFDTDIKCIRQQVHVLWRSNCKRSNWVQSLIKKIDGIFDCLITSDLTQSPVTN
ncbi:hypothetical protein V2J09_012709 [Rumex salicifolius]